MGWQLGLNVQKQRPKAEPRSLGTGKLRLVGGESLGGLWPGALHRGLEIRPWLHCVWGKPQKPRVALGFPSVLGTILSPPQPASSCGWGLWGRAGGGVVFGWPSGFVAVPLGKGGGTLATFLHLRSAQKATGKWLSLGYQMGL